MYQAEKRDDLKISYYVHFLDSLWDKLTEEEFRKVFHEAEEAFIRYHKKKDAAEEKEYERERQEERIKRLQGRMKDNKDIVL